MVPLTPTTERPLPLPCYIYIHSDILYAFLVSLCIACLCSLEGKLHEEGIFVRLFTAASPLPQGELGMRGAQAVFVE